MFRSALLRSAASAAVHARSPVVSRAALVTRRLPAVSRTRTIAPVITSRMYSAGGGLSKDDVEGRIIALLSGFDKVNDPNNIKATAHFSNDLGLDSLDTVEVVMAIEEEFSIEIPDKDADTIHSVDKAVEYILNQPDAH